MKHIVYSAFVILLMSGTALYAAGPKAGSAAANHAARDCGLPCCHHK